MSGWFGICTGNGAISNVTCGRCFEASTSTSGYITARRSWIWIRHEVQLQVAAHAAPTEPAPSAPLELSGQPRVVQTAAATEAFAAPTV